MFYQNFKNLLTAVLALFFLVSCGNDLEKAPRISTEDFFRNPEQTNFQLSPCGDYFTYLKPVNKRMNIFIENLKDSSTSQLTNSEFDIISYFWANSNKILYLVDETGGENYKLFSINLKENRVEDISPKDSASVYIIDPLVEIEDELIVGLNQRDPKIFDVYRLNLKNNKYTLVAENPGNITKWLTDNDGKIRAALQTDGVNTGLLYRDNENEEFRLIERSNFRETFVPVMFTFDNKNLYIKSNRYRDKIALIVYDPINKKEIETVFQNSEVDLDNAIISTKKEKVLGVTYTTYKKNYKFFDKERADVQNYLENKFPNYLVNIVSTNGEETKYLVRVSSDKSHSSYYYFNKETKLVRKLADESPWLNENDMSSMKPITYKSRDGLTIHGYLTLPKGYDAEDLPVIVYPHGGPWLRNVWGFDPVVQLFANRGYAVLQMNYRGSTGYGKEFWEKGFKEWGRYIQNDIADGVDWLIRQEIADPDKIGIFGYSFGGYSSLMNVSIYPDKYQFAVSLNGIVDFTDLINSVPPYWEPFKEMIYEMVANPNTDSLMIAAYSPIEISDSITVPVLITQGKNDTRVKPISVDRYVAKLKSNGVFVKYIFMEDEGHSIIKEENRIKFYKEAESFIENVFSKKLN
ncbi:MAG: S9 family peptidase [Melioribacteraceae bacterium]|nr:S9 family peptidase [Melioribacteraceae bacterium]